MENQQRKNKNLIGLKRNNITSKILTLKPIDIKKLNLVINKSMIKFLNIKKQDKKIQSFILKDIKKIINKNNFILGQEVYNFEKSLLSFATLNML